MKSIKIWAVCLGHVDTSLKNKSRRSGSILRRWNMPPTSDAIAECRFSIANFVRVDHRIYDSLEVEMRLNRKTAIITGAGSGFRASIAQKFAQEGAQVMVANINMDGAQTVANSIGGLAQRVDVASIITGVALEVDGGRCI
jgi:hypothetical protein